MNGKLFFDTGNIIQDTSTSWLICWVHPVSRKAWTKSPDGNDLECEELSHGEHAKQFVGEKPDRSPSERFRGGSTQHQRRGDGRAARTISAGKTAYDLVVRDVSTTRNEHDHSMDNKRSRRQRRRKQSSKDQVMSQWFFVVRTRFLAWRARSKITDTTMLGSSSNFINVKSQVPMLLERTSKPTWCFKYLDDKKIQ